MPIQLKSFVLNGSLAMTLGMHQSLDEIDAELVEEREREKSPAADPEELNAELDKMRLHVAQVQGELQMLRHSIRRYKRQPGVMVPDGETDLNTAGGIRMFK